MRTPVRFRNAPQYLYTWAGKFALHVVALVWKWSTMKWLTVGLVVATVWLRGDLLRKVVKFDTYCKLSILYATCRYYQQSVSVW